MHYGLSAMTLEMCLTIMMTPNLQLNQTFDVASISHLNKIQCIGPTNKSFIIITFLIGLFLNVLLVVFCVVLNWNSCTWSMLYLENWGGWLDTSLEIFSYLETIIETVNLPLRLLRVNYSSRGTLKAYSCESVDTDSKNKEDWPLFVY